MDTAIVPQGNPALILDPTIQDLDFAAPFIDGLAVVAPCRSVLERGGARRDAPLLQGSDESTRMKHISVLEGLLKLNAS